MRRTQTKPASSFLTWIVYLVFLTVLKTILWPFTASANYVNKHFLSYLFSQSLRDQDRIYSIKFIWYNDSVYLHPMIWGSLILWGLSFVIRPEAAEGSAALGVSGWLLFVWFLLLVVCFTTIMYDFDIIRAGIFGVFVLALLGGAYFSTMELHWNPFRMVTSHISHLGAGVSAGFFIVSAYVFTILIVSEVLWAWFFHRVEIDESYVYEHRFLQSSTREPIFARGLKRETRDLLELILLGAADVEHRTRNGYKRFRNVPFASLWLGSAIDKMLDHRRPEQVKLERKQRDESDQARPDDAFHGEHAMEEFGDDGLNDDGPIDDSPDDPGDHGGDDINDGGPDEGDLS